MLKGKAKKVAVKESLAKRASHYGNSVVKCVAPGARVWDSKSKKFRKYSDGYDCKTDSFID